MPIPGGPEEDALIRERLRAGGRRIDGPTLPAELLVREDDAARPNRPH